MGKIKSFLNWLNDNQWLNLIFLVLAILGIIISFYLYFKSKRKKKPIYSKRSINVISDSIQNVGDIQVSYLGKSVNNLTVTKIAIWNSGNETLNYSDQANIDKLRIITEKDIEIFNAEIIFVSAPTNNVRVETSNNKIEFSFDYFDSNQGCIVKIIHSGKSSSDLNVKGTFKSIGVIKEVNANYFNNKLTTLLFGVILTNQSKKLGKNQRKMFTQILPWTLLMIGIIFCVSFSLTDIKRAELKSFLIFLGAIYTIIGILMLFGTNSLPKNFDSFFDDE